MSKIKNIPIQERPYEKMLLYGEKSLSNSELLAIIIKNGTKGQSALEIAQKLINIKANKFNNLRFLQELSINELKEIPGIGKIKAIQLKAVGEITKRISKPLTDKQIKIVKESDIINLFMSELQNEKNEILKIVMLNSKNIIQKISTIAVGNENNITTNIKTIFAEPIKLQIPKIILLHNHPSGDAEPSNVDILFTKKIENVAKMLDIQLLAHIIIGDGTYQNILDKI